MNAKALEARRAYKRQWAKDHPEKVRAAQERYWTKKAAQTAAEPAKPTPADKPNIDPLHANN